MKNSLYIIAGLLVVIWGIIFWGLKGTGSVHIILAVAVFIALVGILFGNKLSKE